MVFEGVKWVYWALGDKRSIGKNVRYWIDDTGRGMFATRVGYGRKLAEGSDFLYFMVFWFLAGLSLR